MLPLAATAQLFSVGACARALPAGSDGPFGYLGWRRCRGVCMCTGSLKGAFPASDPSACSQCTVLCIP